MFRLEVERQKDRGGCVESRGCLSILPPFTKMIIIVRDHDRLAVKVRTSYRGPIAGTKLVIHAEE